MIPEKNIELAAKAADLQNLLEHIAWEEILLPELQKMREAFSKQLVDAVLGVALKTADGDKVSSEQLAGKIFGIDFITDKISKILSQGERALAEIRERGFDLNN
jgi:uncharacterized protein YgfB (UPF0149 family)